MKITDSQQAVLKPFSRISQMATQVVMTFACWLNAWENEGSRVDRSPVDETLETLVEECVNGSIHHRVQVVKTQGTSTQVIVVPVSYDSQPTVLYGFFIMPRYNLIGVAAQNADGIQMILGQAENEPESIRLLRIPDPTPEIYPCESIQ